MWGAAEGKSGKKTLGKNREELVSLEQQDPRRFGKLPNFFSKTSKGFGLGSVGRWAKSKRGKGKSLL